MTPLQRKMAESGFESNDIYDYHVRCLLDSDVNIIRCMNIEGDSDRRMTAFANALAYALEFPHVLYYDLTETQVAPTVIEVRDEDRGCRADDIEITPLERVVSEACAFSEGEDTILILDQLQAADFKQHIRLYHFLKSAQWVIGDAAYTASKRHLLVFLISELPLYHSLQKISFKVWVKTASKRAVDYKPADFGLGDDIREVMQALSEVFVVLHLVPTCSEYERILHDVQTHIRDREGLMHSIYGWTEGVDRSLLFSEKLKVPLKKAIHTIEEYVGLDEVEVKGVEI